jgi:hypothetical protein
MLVQESGVAFNVLAPNEQPIENTAENVSFYQGTLPTDGEYKIDLSTLSGVSESDYSLYVGLEATVQPTISPIPTDIPSPVPTDIPSPIPTTIPSPLPTDIPSPTPIDIPSPSATFDPNSDTRVPVITPTPNPQQP